MEKFPALNAYFKKAKKCQINVTRKRTNYTSGKQKTRNNKDQSRK